MGMRLASGWLVGMHAHRGLQVGARYMTWSSIYSRLWGYVVGGLCMAYMHFIFPSIFKSLQCAHSKWQRT